MDRITLIDKLFDMARRIAQVVNVVDTPDARMQYQTLDAVGVAIGENNGR